jgi:hypothetical protein
MKLTKTQRKLLTQIRDNKLVGHTSDYMLQRLEQTGLIRFGRPTQCAGYPWPPRLHITPAGRTALV